jgi:hypothetical protein
MLLPLLVLNMHAQTAPYVDPVNRGSELLRMCQSVATLEAANGRAATASDASAAAGCTAYISGFNEATAESDSPRKPFCVKDETTTRELVRIYVAYMQENPKWLDYDKSVGLTLALQGAFPCPIADAYPYQGPELDPDLDSDAAH